jgi:DNA polymerase gamma 1
MKNWLRIICEVEFLLRSRARLLNGVRTPRRSLYFQLTSITAKRNEVGVQLLSRSLHEQVFRNVNFPPPPKSYVNIAKQHLRAHGLDPSQGSELLNINFTLPTLQAPTLNQHFETIGEVASQPWSSLADSLASSTLPPRPDHWALSPGWTKYTHEPGGGGFHEHVAAPDEQAVVFDVETLPNISHYTVMAVAASPNAWYAWISPWLIGETEDMVQLPSLGPPDNHRLVVGQRLLRSYTTCR